MATFATLARIAPTVVNLGYPRDGFARGAGDCATLRAAGDEVYVLAGSTGRCVSAPRTRTDSAIRTARRNLM